MEKCCLCKENQADKKGSHIVPHFLLKRIENVDGKKGRDYELGFVIDGFNTSSHFGRNVQLEKLENIYGELSEEELDRNSHPLIVDYIFCTKCENRLSKIESEYAKSIGKYQNKEYSSGIPAEIGFLFWASVLWRISINKKNGVELTKNESELLRRILDRCLKENISEIDFEKMRKSKDLRKITYKILRCGEFTEKHPTHLIIHPKFRKPYVLMVDEFILLFSFKNNFNDFLNIDFFGLKQEALDATINHNSSDEMISPIDEHKYLEMNNKLINLMKIIRISNLDLFFNKLHVGLGGNGNQMPTEIKNEIMSELTSKEKKLGRKHTIEDLRESTIEIMKKYAP